MKRFPFIVLCLTLLAVAACSRGKSSSTSATLAAPTNMEGAYANCEFSSFYMRIGDADLFEVNINGLPVHEFYGAELICQSCDDPANWRIVQRRGVALSDVFTSIGVAVSDTTPVNVIARDGWDPWRKKLGADPYKIPPFAYFRDYAYIYVGSPGLKDPSLPVNAPNNFAKDPHYPEYEGRSLCIGYNHDTPVGAAEQAGMTGMDIAFGSCFGTFRYSMLEKINDDEYGIIEIDPVP